MFKTRKFLSAVSVMALMVTTPALADTDRTAHNDATTHTQGLNAKMVHDQDGDLDYPRKETVKVNYKMTAAGLIGQDVHNVDGEAVATLEDIIVDASGDVERIILSDGEWTGMGKLVALDNDDLLRRQSDAESELFMTITESDIENAQPFSYENANVISVSNIMDGYLLGTGNQRLADINNILFEDGQAEKLIVDVDENLSVTSHHVAMDIASVQMVQDQEQGIHFKMNAEQSRNFKNLKQSL